MDRFQEVNCEISCLSATDVEPSQVDLALKLLGLYSLSVRSLFPLRIYLMCYSMLLNSSSSPSLRDLLIEAHSHASLSFSY